MIMFDAMLFSFQQHNPVNAREKIAAHIKIMHIRK